MVPFIGHPCGGENKAFSMLAGKEATSLK